MSRHDADSAPERSIVLGGTTIHNSMSFLTDVAQLGVCNSEQGHHRISGVPLGTLTQQGFEGS